MTFRPNTRLKHRAVGINIYGGGFTLGMLKHFNVLAQLEEINLGKRTFDANFEGIWRPLSIDDWASRDLTSVEVVYANPPCAPWSSANVSPGHTNDKRFFDARLELTRHTMTEAQRLGPQIFISESVENAYNVGESHYHPFVKEWQDLGYKVTWFLTDAILHGSPSKRRRFHFIAHKVKLDLASNIPGLMPGFKPTTVRDAIGDLKFKKTFGTIDKHSFRSFEPRLDKLIRLCPIGGNMHRVGKHVSNYDGPRASFLVKRWGWDAPSGTMVGFDFIHPDGQRLITFREAMRLCTYPDTFTCHNAVEAVDTVLPLIGDWFGGVFREALRRDQRLNDLELEVVDHRPFGKPYHLGAVYPKHVFQTVDFRDL